MVCYNAPDVIQQDNLGIAAYDKPSHMLNALRDVVLGPERFDAAFREYINRWAFKHPTPWDFFHTMENVAGEDLGWFWRAWVLNTWKLDQISKRSKICKKHSGKWSNDNNGKSGKNADACNGLVKEANGKEHTINLPVEIWQRGAEWTFGVPTTSEIKEVILDPDKKLPDWNRDNNKWKKAF